MQMTFLTREQLAEVLRAHRRVRRLPSGAGECSCGALIEWDADSVFHVADKILEAMVAHDVGATAFHAPPPAVVLPESSPMFALAAVVVHQRVEELLTLGDRIEPLLVETDRAADAAGVVEASSLVVLPISQAEAWERLQQIRRAQEAAEAMERRLQS